MTMSSSSGKAVCFDQDSGELPAAGETAVAMVSSSDASSASREDFGDSDVTFQVDDCCRMMC